MKKIVILLLLFFSALVPAQSERRPWERRPGVVLYQLKPDASATQRASLAGALSGAHAMAMPSAQASRAFQAMMIASPGKDEEDLAQDLLRTGAVIYAEPDYRMPAAVLPNDPGISSEWHLAAIHADSAWNITTGASSVVVAVCDSGVDSTHPDLAANLSLPGHNSADGSANTAPVADHGTSVAGIIGAVGNNGLGGAGIAWNVKVLPVRVTNFPDASAWCSDMASGVEWAADHGAKVINLSYDITGCPNTINAAAQYAQTKGAVSFVAAGNSGMNISAIIPSPHAFIFVGATTASGQRASFSNFGSPVDLLAPGVSIYAPLPGNTYTSVSGTSFSAPISAGVAALLYSLNPSWTPEQIRVFMLATARTLSAQSGLNGYGTLDASAALTSAQSVMTGGAMPYLPSAPGTGPAAVVSDLDHVVVYPNPWRSDRHSGVPIVFNSLSSDCTVKIFTMSGFWVRTLTPVLDQASWDLKTDSGDSVASGIYLYSITSRSGHETQGKLGVLR